MQSSYQSAYGASQGKQAAGGAVFPPQGVDWGSLGGDEPQLKQQPKQQQQAQQQAAPSGGFGFGGGSSIFGEPSAHISSGLNLGLGSGYAQETGEYNCTTSSVKEYAYQEDKNYRFRPQMEDTHCIVDKLGNDNTCGMFAIFDGHGGRQVSDHCAERFPVEMRKEVIKNPPDLVQSITSVFQKIDNELRLLDSDGCGSTACVCIVRKEGPHQVLYVANIGDTRGVLSKSGVAERMSIDHKCDNADEVHRIKAAQGIVLNDRVGGVLAVTRAFGDHALRKSGLTAQPHIVKYILRPFDKFLVIASDGIWDELSDQDAVNYCKEDVNAKQSAQAIVKSAIDKGSKDNISVIVVRFNGSSQAF